MTTKEVSMIIKTLSPKKVAELCRTGKLYAIKSPGPFGKWDIPPASLDLYIQYNPVYKTFLEGKVTCMVSMQGESYTVAELATIFDQDIKTIRKWIRSARFPHYCVPWYIPITKRTKIPGISVVMLMHVNSEEVKKLQDRHMDLLARGDEMESLIRHLLMFYAYYESNGYLV